MKKCYLCLLFLLTITFSRAQGIDKRTETGCNGKWEGRNPHDMFVLAQNSSVSHLNADILHNTWPTKAAFLKQCKNFAAISAQHLSAEDPAYRLLFKSITHSIFRFIKAYVIKTGFLSGYTGLFISYHMSKEVFLKYYLAYKIRSQKHHSTH